MNMDGADGEDNSDDKDDGDAEVSPSRSWFGSALLRLVFLGAALQAAYLYSQLRQDGGGVGDEGGRRLEATCAMFTVLGALLVLALQSELRGLLLGRPPAADGVRRRGAGTGAASPSLRLHPGDLFESWMYEYVAESSAEVSPQSEATSAAQPPAPAPAPVGGRVVAVPVFVRLQGRVLSVWAPDTGPGRTPPSRLEALVPRIALWTEQEANLTKARASLTRCRRYVLQGGSVSLLPEHVSKGRRWSRKHPICVTASQRLADEAVVADVDFGPALDPSLRTASMVDMPAVPVVIVTAPSSQELDLTSRELDLQADDPSPAPAVASSAPTGSAIAAPDVGVSAHRGSSSTSTTPDSASTLSSSSSVPPDPFYVFTPARSECIPYHGVVAYPVDPANSPAADPDPARCPGSDLASEASGSGDLEDAVADAQGVEDVQERLLQIVSEKLVGMVDQNYTLDDEGHIIGQVPAEAQSADGAEGRRSLSLLLLARSARQKEEWFWRLRRACGEPHPLDDAAVFEDYVAALHHYVGAEALAGGLGLDAGLDGLNALAGRVMFDACHSKRWADVVLGFVQRRVAALRVPEMVERPAVTAFHCSTVGVRLRRAGPPVLDSHGLWVDLDVSYRGLMRVVLTTRLNLVQQHQRQQQQEQQQERGAEAEECPDNNGRDGSGLGFGPEREDPVEVPPAPAPPPPPGQPERGTWRLFRKLAENRFFQAALTALSNTDVVLAMEVRGLDGVLCVHVPPPPSDRVWLGFRGVPRLRLVTVPRVGSRTLRHALLCRLIERKLHEHLERVLVLPNMTSVVVPFPFSVPSAPGPAPAPAPTPPTSR